MKSNVRGEDVVKKCLNVRQKLETRNVLKNLKTWKPENLKTLKILKMILETCWTTFVMSCHQFYWQSIKNNASRQLYRFIKICITNYDPYQDGLSHGKNNYVAQDWMSLWCISQLCSGKQVSLVSKSISNSHSLQAKTTRFLFTPYQSICYDFVWFLICVVLLII